jgi:uncharacterized protein with PQ loop repeat
MMVPQVIQGAKTKDMKSVSWGMIIVYLINCILWAIYGYGTGSNPLVLANSIAFLIGLYQFYLKYRY